MAVQKSGTYWTTLQDEQNPARLAGAFRDCAAIDPAWALDQAHCLYLNTDPRSAQAAGIREFCAGVADDSSQYLDATERISALWIAADSADPHDAAQATQKMVALLETMAGTQPREAMGCAAALKSRPGHPLLAQALAGFMIDHAGPEDGVLLLGLVRTGAMEKFTGEQKDRLLRRVGCIAYDKPYDALLILDEISREDVSLTPAQDRRLEEMRRTLHGSPEALLALLEREYGEDTAALRQSLRQAAAKSAQPAARLH